MKALTGGCHREPKSVLSMVTQDGIQGTEAGLES